MQVSIKNHGTSVYPNDTIGEGDLRSFLIGKYQQYNERR